MTAKLLKVPDAVRAVFVALVPEGHTVGEGFADTLAEMYTAAKRGIKATAESIKHADAFAIAERALAADLGVERKPGRGPWSDAVGALRKSAGIDLSTPEGNAFRSAIVRAHERLDDAERDPKSPKSPKSPSGPRTPAQKLESACKSVLRYLGELQSQDDYDAEAVLALMGDMPKQVAVVQRHTQEQERLRNAS